MDLDGTLLNGSHVVTAAARHKLHELCGLGVEVVVASGRSGPAMYAIVEYLSLPSLKTFAVAYNGACCYEFDQGFTVANAKKKTMFRRCVDSETVKTLVNFCEDQTLLLQVYVGDDIFVKCRTTEHRDFCQRYSTLTGCAHAHVESYDAIDKSQVLKMLIMTDDPDSVLETLKALDMSATIVRGSPPFFVEVLHDTVCKGSGLKNLCAHIGVALDAVIAFGDGDNDLEFIQAAGLGVAMINGRDNIKSNADRITLKDNTQDGVPHFLEILQQEGILPSPS